MYVLNACLTNCTNNQRMCTTGTLTCTIPDPPAPRARKSSPGCEGRCNWTATRTGSGTSSGAFTDTTEWMRFNTDSSRGETTIWRLKIRVRIIARFEMGLKLSDSCSRSEGLSFFTVQLIIRQFSTTIWTTFSPQGNIFCNVNIDLWSAWLFFHAGIGYGAAIAMNDVQHVPHLSEVHISKLNMAVFT